MATGRKLEPLRVPDGAAVSEVLPVLERALAGEGPALLPVAAGQPLPALGVGEQLDSDDDPADPTALVIATSGSTGTPKGTVLSTSALRASAAATHERLGGPGIWLLALPAQHIGGMQVLIRSLLAGTRPGVVETSGGFRPEAFVRAAQALRGSGPRYTALVPTQLSRLLDDSAGRAALARFDAVLIGGAATAPHTLRNAERCGVRVVTTYGMSETSGGCVYDGEPLRGVEVRLGDAGEISLSGPMLAKGYRGANSAEAVHGGEAFSDGWFRTGDLGRWSDGRLDVLGRADDIIITGGVNVAPRLVERILTAEDGVRDACVVGVDDPEWGQAVVAAVVADQATDITRLRAAVRAKAGAAATPKRVVIVDDLPLLGPGKPDRNAIREALSA